VVKNENGEPDRVYVAGHSSGGMMTNVMLGTSSRRARPMRECPSPATQQGAVDGLGWNADCAQGKVILTAKDWGDVV
jgi:acetylxylan esterase